MIPCLDFPTKSGRWLLIKLIGNSWSGCAELFGSVAERATFTRAIEGRKALVSAETGDSLPGL